MAHEVMLGLIPAGATDRDRPRRMDLDEKKHCRKGTSDFQDHLKAHGAACAFALVAASNPTAWLPN